RHTCKRVWSVGSGSRSLCCLKTRFLYNHHSHRGKSWRDSHARPPLVPAGPDWQFQVRLDAGVDAFRFAFYCTRAEPIALGQPIRAYLMDLPRRVLAGCRLRDGPDTRRVSLARRRIRFVSFRWGPLYSVATTCGAAASPEAL